MKILDFLLQAVLYSIFIFVSVPVAIFAFDFWFQTFYRISLL